MADAGITPRWEWRTFGVGFPTAEEYLSVLEPTAVQESEEVYLISPLGDTVKVRFGLMDIKLLRDVALAGLERWEPVFKAEFPLDDAQIALVFDALRETPPTLERTSYTYEQFVAELVDPHPGVRTVPVAKKRVRYTIEGCIGEFTEVRTGGWLTRTIAIESTDRDAVAAAVRKVGLGARVNTSYPRGLGALFDNEPPRYAAIDVGTNSVKFHIGQPVAGGGWESLVDRAEVTQLGEGLAEAGVISPEATRRTAEAIRGMVADARAHLVREIAAVGTAGLRIAGNRDEVLSAIELHAGVPVEVISGEEESRLAYLAALAGLGRVQGDVVVFDTGGGSSQFTFGRGGDVLERFSVDVGAVRFTKQFALDAAVDRQTIADAKAAIAEDLSRLAGRPRPDALVGMGGALTNMTAVMLGLSTYDPDRVQGAVLERSEVERQIELYASMPAPQRRSIVGLQPKRADVILAGACIVATVMDLLGQDRLTVSDRGLRHGLIVERFGRGEIEVLDA